jgi:alpha-beta hydrolase superfamily lysophospholipase
VVLIGMSLGGGLVIDVAARDHHVAAVVAIVPNLDGTKTLPGTSPSEQLRFACAAFADRTGRLIGKEPVLVPVFGKVGDTTALISRDGAWDCCQRRVRQTQYGRGAWG